jgi:hypothetical protein
MPGPAVFARRFHIVALEIHLTEPYDSGVIVRP